MNGINFIQPLFHAVVEGRKTMTRQVVKTPRNKRAFGWLVVKNHTGYVIDVCWTDENERFSDENGNNNVIKPRYKVGETLYLKEPYYPLRPQVIKYKYDNNFVPPARNGVCLTTGRKISGMDGWHYKRTMPEKHARYFIEITGVKVERLQGISDEDCLREGIFYDIVESDYFHYHDCENRFYCADCEEKGRERLVKEVLEDRERFCFDNEDDEDWIRDELSGYSCEACDGEPKACDICGKDLSGYRYDDNSKCFYSPQQAYAALTDKTKRGTWDSNPYVWVYEFKLVK